MKNRAWRETVQPNLIVEKSTLWYSLFFIRKPVTALFFN